MKLRGSLAALAMLAAAGCADTEVDPATRTVALTTTACGDASRTSGVGVIIDDGHVLTTAHTVIGADMIEVMSGEADGATANGETLTATIVALSPQADLAVLEVVGVSGPEVQIGEVAAGDQVVVPAIDAIVTVKRRVEVRIEGVRSLERVERQSIEVDTRVELGESGSGVFTEGGELVGVIYGRSTIHDDRSFAVRSEEIADFLDMAERGEYACDATQHQVVASTANVGSQ